MFLRLFLCSMCCVIGSHKILISTNKYLVLHDIVDTDSNEEPITSIRDMGSSSGALHLYFLASSE